MHDDNIMLILINILALCDPWLDNEITEQLAYPVTKVTFENNYI